MHTGEYMFLAERDTNKFHHVYLQAKEFEAEEKLKMLKDSLEMALKDANEKVIKLMNEKQEAEEKLKAVNLNISSIQRALDNKEKQLLLNVQLARSEIKFM